MPSIVLESLNCTIPVAVLGETVAVNVTELPVVNGFFDDTSVVVVVARLIWFTVCASADEVLVASFVSPKYAAVMV